MWPDPQFPADLVTFTEKIVKDYLRYKTIFCHKVALDAQLMNFFI